MAAIPEFEILGFINPGSAVQICLEPLQNPLPIRVSGIVTTGKVGSLRIWTGFGLNLDRILGEFPEVIAHHSKAPSI